MDHLSVNVILSELNGAMEVIEEVSGVPEKGIFIPFRFNPIYKKKKGGWLLNLNALARKPNEWGQLYGLKPRFSVVAAKKVINAGLESNQWLGYITRSKSNFYNYMSRSMIDNKNNIDNILNDNKDEKETK